MFTEPRLFLLILEIAPVSLLPPEIETKPSRPFYFLKVNASVLVDSYREELYDVLGNENFI